MSRGQCDLKAFIHSQALLKFSNQRSADEFYNSLNGTAYNSFEPDVCNLAYVARVEVIKDSKTCHMPINGFTELPTCPVCLERMDESVQGILTILCNHSFHGKCLDQWYDSSCPVCRYCQTPELLPDNRCVVCGSPSTTQDTLWICLVCGHIGCGRYVEGHAYKHFKDTGHTFAMQLGMNNRVWDYAGDNYVHRLLQNKDGEPVELKAANNEAGNKGSTNQGSHQMVHDEKIDAVQLEYTYLLTNQLETQRHYFEESMAQLESEKQSQIDRLREENHQLITDNTKLNEIVGNLKKDKVQLEKKVNQLTVKLNKTSASLEEEMELNKCLRSNQDGWQKRLSETEKNVKEMRLEKDSQIDELREQVRDLMFFLEAKEKLEAIPPEMNVSQNEVADSQVVIGEASTSQSKRNNRSKNKKK